ncbi:MAG: proP 1 [Caulobacteraceae bacterium]|nr:proP 1 [Caulobacteraceae bacterium]
MAAMDITAGAAPAAKDALPAHHVAAVVVGNSLEFYDFLTYSFFAAQIGRTFFPSDNPVSSLLASLATFGAGFLTRPVGAFFIGRLADRIGRRPAMFLSFALMGAGMLGLALTPSYAAIGIFAPILAIVFRLVQGFALGGELGPSTAYLIEAAPERRRGVFVSLQYSGQQAAVLAAGLIGYVLAKQLSPAALDAWGWRAAFLVGVVIVPFGLILRKRLAETLTIDSDTDPPRPEAVRAYWRLAVLALLLLTSSTIGTYALGYLTTYAQETLHMTASAAFGATVSQGVVGMVMVVVGGILSDRFGRKPTMVWPTVLLVAVIWPSFWAINRYPTAEVLFAATAVMAAISSISSASILVAITESLPKRVRAGSLALIYAVAISVFGGSTQFVIAWLTDLLKDPLAPAFYMIGATVLGLAAMLFMHESAPVTAQSASAAPS